MSTLESGVQNALRELIQLDRAALIERWVATFGCPAPKNSQVTLLRTVLAWQFQMATAKPALGRSRRLASTLPILRRPRTQLAPGTCLVREWRDRTHHVTVLAKGFEFDGRIYRSLTAIAWEITGTAWSGPAFFGLRG